MKTDWTGQPFCTVAELTAALAAHDPEALVFVEYDGHEQNATGEVESYPDHFLDEGEDEGSGRKGPALKGERFKTVRIRVGHATLGPEF